MRGGNRNRERDQALRRARRRRRRQPRDRAGRVLLAARSVGLRQDDDAADARRLRGPERGPDHARGRAGRERAAVQARREHGLPELRALRAPRHRRQRRLRPAPHARSTRTRSSAASARRSSSSTSPSARDARTNELSGGQKQRVALARALVNRPKVLLLDEPLGALDLKLRKQMQVELKQIQREVGITFVYVTHDQEEALSMSDRIAVMHAGRVAQCGPPEDVYEHPSGEFVAGFIGISNLIEGTVADGGQVRLDNGMRMPVDAARRRRARRPRQPLDPSREDRDRRGGHRRDGRDGGHDRGARVPWGDDADHRRARATVRASSRSSRPGTAPAPTTGGSRG